ncbi:MAG: hydrogenase nickel incorporation protein HypB [Lentisphaerota bacterium]
MNGPRSPGWHTHADGTSHAHPHDHEDGHEHVTRTIEVEKKVLAKNDEAAERNRRWLAERGVVAVNLISSPGSGKTYLLERTLDRLKGKVACAVITGDVQTDNDARRLMGRGAPVEQIETRGACHLDAIKVGALLPKIVKKGLQLLFIENVGNLVCPAAFDLGENFKIALLSVAEGEDKPLKYPVLFSDAGVVIITKMDLVPHLDWDLKKCRKYIQQVHPGVHIIELSAKTGEGMDAWIEYLGKLGL